MSASSRSLDEGVKVDEYAGAGIPRYWTVDRDPAQTVTMYGLEGDIDVSRVRMPLEWVLNTEPADHLGEV